MPECYSEMAAGLNMDNLLDVRFRLKRLISVHLLVELFAPTAQLSSPDLRSDNGPLTTFRALGLAG
jgi:hypothetical protein